MVAIQSCHHLSNSPLFRAGGGTFHASFLLLLNSIWALSRIALDHLRPLVIEDGVCTGQHKLVSWRTGTTDSGMRKKAPQGERIAWPVIPTLTLGLMPPQGVPVLDAMNFKRDY